MPAALTIGEFSQLTHLSIRTLRRYHEAGLLTPDRVDPSSGYRYYVAEQIPTAQVIHQLRGLDVPLAEVARIMATDDPGARAELVSTHLGRLEGQLERTRAAVVSLRRLLAPDPAPLEVIVRSVPSRVVAAVTGMVDLGDVLAWFSTAAADLDEALRAGPAPGSLSGHYDNELFTEGRGRTTVFRETAVPPTVGRVVPKRLAAAEIATTVHHGVHDDIGVTYGALGSWVTDNALSVAGPVQEVYAVGPADTPDMTRWRTEIGWPVFRIAAR